MRQFSAFVKLGRPVFLVGGFVMHALGVAVALYNGAALNVSALLWGQLAISAVQWMTHYSNDYFDQHADRANQTPTRWSGGSRVLVDGSLPPQAGLAAALVLAGVAGVALAGLAATGAPPLALGLIVMAGLLAWFYSAPPVRLHSRGLGELATAVIVPVLTPLTGYVLQAGRIDALPLLAIFPLCCLQFAMLLAIEFPDAAGDRAVNKRTLVVRLGEQGAARLYSVALATAYLALPLLVLAGLPPLVALAIVGMSPLAVVQWWRVRRGDTRTPERWNSFAFTSIGLLFGTAAVEVVAFVALVGTR